ncbi:C-3 sterol dehydrogenase/C-4 decarboxylase family protein [Usnea florida]
MTIMASVPLSSVLVVGGCGFLGYEIVATLVNEPNCSVSVLSRNPGQPRVAGVSYHACDITDIDALRAIVLEIRPQTIIHTASPVYYEDEINNALLHQINVVGTQNLLDVSKTTESVRSFVYTSSSSVHAGSNFHFITEEAPVLDRSFKANEYAITKALADTMVLKANCQELRTLCLRPPVIYGERDGQSIPGALAVLQDKKTNIQLGDNTNLYDSIYVGNAASAHVKAAKALLMDDRPGLKVDGEAFFVTDDSPIPFWDFQRKIWAAAGDKTPLDKVHVIPAWVGMALATVVEYLFWICTLDQVLPPKTLRRDVLRYTFTYRTFCIEKAKERLGYKPLIDTNEGIKRGVEWALQNQARQR